MIALANPPRIDWPQGKRFAFTIFDDTDRQTLDNGPPVYRFLEDLGFRTTKSVWTRRGAGQPRVGGTTCQQPEYLAWVQSLKQRGFEIGLHNTTYHTSTRGETEEGLDRFREFFGNDPRTLANHVGCHEGLYWGAHRLTGINRWIYRVLTRDKKHGLFQGHVESSPLFWGDICRTRVKYVRNFVFNEINTLKACPCMPYHDPARPYVRYWYASSEGAEVNAFVRTVSEKNQDRLEAEGGACIMYTHLACGFYENGRLQARFKQLMERLSRKQGWFVPVGTLLDHLLKRSTQTEIDDAQRARLERRWLWHKIRSGGTS